MKSAEGEEKRKAWEEERRGRKVKEGGRREENEEGEQKREEQRKGNHCLVANLTGNRVIVRILTFQIYCSNKSLAIMFCFSGLCLYRYIHI